MNLECEFEFTPAVVVHCVMVGHKPYWRPGMGNDGLPLVFAEAADAELAATRLRKVHKQVVYGVVEVKL